MKFLMELMGLGDNNSLGKSIDDARKNLNKLKKHSNKDIRKTAITALSCLDNIETNTNVLQTDGYSLLNYLQQLANPNISQSTLLGICDAIGTYDDSEDE